MTGSQNKIDRRVIKNITDQVSTLMEAGNEVVLVSSGAIGAGLGLLKLAKKKKSISELQAIASVGQNHLMDIYNEFFAKRKHMAGQILLTQEDFNDRKRFLNIKHTINTLLRHNAIPVINENDSVSTEEIKCGDNDRLSSLVADLSDSDMLIILTDVDGLYDGNKKVIKEVIKVTNDMRSFCHGKGCEISTGGMITKIEAIKMAAESGIECFIAKGRKKDVLLNIFGGKNVGTRFIPSSKKINARKRWIAHSMKSRGKITIDQGAGRAIETGRKSLLPSGIVGSQGKFKDGDVVDIIDPKGRTIAKGITNYTRAEIEKIKGLKTSRLEEVLGYKDYAEVVHKDNLVILDG